MNFNKDNEQKLVKRQNKKCYDKILLMFLSFPTRGSPLLLEPLILIAIVTQASGSFLDLLSRTNFQLVDEQRIQ